MRTFDCEQCGQALYYENSTCLRCGSALAFLPDRMDLCAIEPVGDDAPGLWQRRMPKFQRAAGAAGASAAPGRWRLCMHHEQTQACNFAVPEDDLNPLCVSCRQTRVLPDLSVPQNQRRFYRIEGAKRRLFFTLARLGLVNPHPAPGVEQGPRYEFLADQPGQPVLTGHSNGVITLNIAEADDDERERRRLALGEPYRTLLGHLRHESGHYYWDVLIERAGRHERFRSAFGDERADYAEALRQHYERAAHDIDWQERHVSAYATAHPWEDWAETWAHYLHMVDLLETAASFETRLVLHAPGADVHEHVSDPFARADDFDALVAQWVPLTVLVNSLTRSLGQEDAYPFALSVSALDKLRVVHEIVHEHVRQGGEQSPAPG
ncbi:putative zinc-binding metallopeptidase [Ramlibacter sp. AN1015]|uniref:zinc-binding metallopeptidase family protein n=1 Tax=Ramlibacter sp. AN1015 TaxID=3133428 RepID=UPI0030BCB0D1